MPEKVGGISPKSLIVEQAHNRMVKGNLQGRTVNISSVNQLCQRVMRLVTHAQGTHSQTKNRIKKAVSRMSGGTQERRSPKVRAIEDVRNNTEILKEFVSHHPKEVNEETLESIRNIQDECVSLKNSDSYKFLRESTNKADLDLINGPINDLEKIKLIVQQTLIQNRLNDENRLKEPENRLENVAKKIIREKSEAEKILSDYRRDKKLTPEIQQRLVKLKESRKKSLEELSQLNHDLVDLDQELSTKAGKDKREILGNIAERRFDDSFYTLFLTEIPEVEEIRHQFKEYAQRITEKRPQQKRNLLEETSLQEKFEAQIERLEDHNEHIEGEELKRKANSEMETFRYLRHHLQNIFKEQSIELPEMKKKYESALQLLNTPPKPNDREDVIQHSRAVLGMLYASLRGHQEKRTQIGKIKESVHVEEREELLKEIDSNIKILCEKIFDLELGTFELNLPGLFSPVELKTREQSIRKQLQDIKAILKKTNQTLKREGDNEIREQLEAELESLRYGLDKMIETLKKNEKTQRLMEENQNEQLEALDPNHVLRSALQNLSRLPQKEIALEGHLNRLIESLKLVLAEDKDFHLDHQLDKLLDNVDAIEDEINERAGKLFKDIETRNDLNPVLFFDDRGKLAKIHNLLDKRNENSHKKIFESRINILSARLKNGNELSEAKELKRAIDQSVDAIRKLEKSKVMIKLKKKKLGKFKVKLMDDIKSLNAVNRDLVSILADVAERISPDAIGKPYHKSFDTINNEIAELVRYCADMEVELQNE